MTTIRKLALVLYLVCLFTSYSNAQDLTPGQVYTTPNIVTPPTTSGASSWTGAVNQQSLTCWGSGDPGYCGPAPITLPNGNIHFSYGSSYIFQQQAVARVLPQITGLQVSGFNFGFTAKNGNGWDDGRTDTLNAVVRFWDTSGGRGMSNLLERRDYSLNYKFNWTTFNYSETFTTPLQASSIGQVQYGFIGRDNNGWAGPYGPEINQVNFSLKYSVDPCQSDPLSSPTCPGYLAALAKLLPPPPPPQEPVVVAAEPVQQAQQEVLAVAAPAAASTQQAGQLQQSAPQQTVASAPQQERSSSGPGLGFALNLISRNADRERTLTQQVTQQAIQEAAASGTQAAQQAVSVATTSATQSQELTLLQLPGSMAASGSITGVQIQQVLQTNPVLVQQQQQQQQQQASSGRVTAVVTTETQLPVFSAPQQNTLTQTEQTGSQLSSNFLTDLTSPLRSIIESLPQSVPESAVQTVRANVQDSTLAGGVQLSSLGSLPQGYAGYLQLQLQDAKFYDIKPIYPNQRVVDNARVLRELGSDALHQRLVDSQYK